VEHTVLTFVFVTSFLSFVRFSKKKKYIYRYLGFVRQVMS